MTLISLPQILKWAILKIEKGKVVSMEGNPEITITLTSVSTAIFLMLLSGS